MEKKRDIENNGFMPQKGNPLHEKLAEAERKAH